MGNNWTNTGWQEYVYWQAEDRKTLKRINKLIIDIARNGHEGLGRPEALTGNWSGWYSRRIDDKNRLIYRVDGDDIVIASCRGHYDDK
jgi:toxin YoeB